MIPLSPFGKFQVTFIWPSFDYFNLFLVASHMDMVNLDIGHGLRNENCF